MPKKRTVSIELVILFSSKSTFPFLYKKWTETRWLKENLPFKRIFPTVLKLIFFLGIQTIGCPFPSSFAKHAHLFQRQVFYDENHGRSYKIVVYSYHETLEKRGHCNSCKQKPACPRWKTHHAIEILPTCASQK